MSQRLGFKSCLTTYVTLGTVPTTLNLSLLLCKRNESKATESLAGAPAVEEVTGFVTMCTGARESKPGPWADDA